MAIHICRGKRDYENKSHSIWDQLEWNKIWLTTKARNFRNCWKSCQLAVLRENSCFRHHFMSMVCHMNHITSRIQQPKKICGSNMHKNSRIESSASTLCYRIEGRIHCLGTLRDPIFNIFTAETKVWFKLFTEKVSVNANSTYQSQC